MISRQICVKSCRCWTQSSFSCLDTACWRFGIKVASCKINPTTHSQLSNLNIEMRMSLHPGFNLETVSVVLVFLALTSSFDPCSDIKALRYISGFSFSCVVLSVLTHLPYLEYILSQSSIRLFISFSSPASPPVLLKHPPPMLSMLRVSDFCSSILS